MKIHRKIKASVATGLYGSKKLSYHRYAYFGNMPFLIIQFTPRGLWALAHEENTVMDDLLFERHGLMPFRLAIAKLRLVT